MKREEFRKISQEKILILDGATGTNLQKRGLPSGVCPEKWILENPDGIPFYYINYVTIVGERTFITDVPELNPTETPSSLEWMCSDAERSRIQGDGCVSYCSESTVYQMELNGKACYANGERIIYGK